QRARVRGVRIERIAARIVRALRTARVRGDGAYERDRDSHRAWRAARAPQRLGGRWRSTAGRYRRRDRRRRRTGRAPIVGVPAIPGDAERSGDLLGGRDAVVHRRGSGLLRTGATGGSRGTIACTSAGVDAPTRSRYRRLAAGQ